MIHIYNTLTKQKELLKPIDAGKIGLYVCGLTVYDDCHIGHGRLFLWFDTLVRYLRSIGYQVTYVRNITDIDDKIIKRSQELKTTYQDLTQKVIASMHCDEKALNIIPPDHEPRVTDHIANIIEMIQILIDKGFAYEAKNGDIYYSVAKFKSYGELAHQDISCLLSGARVEANNEDKLNPLDFVLWKAAKPLEPFWRSPWGNGRPGWHIECSAMAKKYLGNHFDIHGGGSDLQFPHHQNELAQSEAANDSPFANYWMHIGFVQCNQEKMSKSLGNFFTLKEVLNKCHPEVLRYLVVSSHYRSPINFSEENLDHAKSALHRLYMTLRDPSSEKIIASKNDDDQFSRDFHAAMADDFNTPKAIATLFDLTHEIHQLHNDHQFAKAKQQRALLKHLSESLGLLQEDPETFLKSGVDHQLVESLIIARNNARNNKLWDEADKIRTELATMGIALKDTSSGTTWVVEQRRME